MDREHVAVCPQRQSITALMLARWLAAGYGHGEPLVAVWLQELRRG